MSDFHFKRLEKYKTGGSKDKMQLSIPLPKSPSGKVYRWCPNDECTPRLFLLGDGQRPENIDVSKLKRAPGAPGTTCPYCGIEAEDSEFNHEDDIEAIKNYIGWVIGSDIEDQFKAIFKKSKNWEVKTKSSTSTEPKVWREDLLRNLSCNICGREYGVYGVALFCPDCGSKNLHVHFEREIELILQQIDLAEQVTESGNKELSYRILGNAHEDVLTAFETYQKVFYKFMVRKRFPKDEADKMTSKQSISNRFQNIERGKELYKNLSVNNPFAILNETDLVHLKTNIEKRHIIGHNLSMVDESYSDSENREKPGTTVDLLAEEISEFAQISKNVVLELERLLE